MSLIDVERLREIAEIEFTDIVVEAFSSGINELRIIPTDGSFVDVWFSLKLQGRYSFHWERRAIDGTIYRHDNTPHQRGEVVAIFITAVKPACQKAISALSPQKLCGNSSNLCGPCWALPPVVLSDLSTALPCHA